MMRSVSIQNPNAAQVQGMHPELGQNAPSTGSHAPKQTRNKNYSLYLQQQEVYLPEGQNVVYVVWAYVCMYIRFFEPKMFDRFWSIWCHFYLNLAIVAPQRI